MIAEATLLATLQHADSFFPSGATAFSWGLETAVADKLVKSAVDVRRFLLGQLRFRWATCDRLILIAVHRNHEDLDRVAAIDLLAEATALPREMREGSRRAGAALLGMHARLGTPNAAAYLDHQREGRVPGHIAAVQGLLWASIGLTEMLSATMAAHCFCVAGVGAALRLGVISHVAAQQILVALHPTIATLLAGPVIDVENICAYTPAADIAIMRHEAQTTRLFAN